MSYFDTGDKIRDLRKERGLNQDQLAELASLNRVTVAKYESGRVEPGAHALARIADALDVSADVLLGRSDEVRDVPETPKTDEAWILARGVDKLPKDQREQALAVVRAMFAQYADYFEQRRDAGES
jgi:transcriptional regulator with XRE-family HTH domain